MCEPFARALTEIARFPVGFVEGCSSKNRNYEIFFYIFRLAGIVSMCQTVLQRIFTDREVSGVCVPLLAPDK